MLVVLTTTIYVENRGKLIGSERRGEERRTTCSERLIMIYGNNKKSSYKHLSFHYRRH